MSIVVTYLAYLLISVGLTVLAGNVLSRSGRLFLAEALGGSDCAANDRAAKGITSLIVVSFYLISLGVIVLNMRIPSDRVSAVHAIQLLATKVGLVLLVLGALYLFSVIALTKLRRRLKIQGQSTAFDRGAAPTTSEQRATLWHPSADRAAR
jgi:hypothetical protein